jgi:mono/diheme cytochrome c family protein
MIGKSIRIFAVIFGLLLASCGTVATPVWEAAQAPTEAVESAAETEAVAAPTVEPTAVPPTETSVPPTATPVPPTETPVPPSATPVPPTAAPTEEVTEEAGMDAAHVEGAQPSEADTAAIAAAEAAGDPAAGQQLFTTMVAEAGFMCSTCHSTTPDQQRLIGPGLYNVREHGLVDAHMEGQDLITYLHTSIVDPQAHIVPGDPPYPPIMPTVYGQVFTEQQISDIIAYLLSLHD